MAGYRPVPGVSGIEFCRSRIAAMDRAFMGGGSRGCLRTRTHGPRQRADSENNTRNHQPAVEPVAHEIPLRRLDRKRDCTHATTGPPRIGMAYAARQIWCFPPLRCTQMHCSASTFGSASCSHASPAYGLADQSPRGFPPLGALFTRRVLSSPDRHLAPAARGGPPPADAPPSPRASRAR